MTAWQVKRIIEEGPEWHAVWFIVTKEGEVPRYCATASYALTLWRLLDGEDRQKMGETRTVG